MQIGLSTARSKITKHVTGFALVFEDKAGTRIKLDFSPTEAVEVMKILRRVADGIEIENSKGLS